jgi:hypothetical protein
MLLFCFVLSFFLYCIIIKWLFLYLVKDLWKINEWMNERRKDVSESRWTTTATHISCPMWVSWIRIRNLLDVMLCGSMSGSWGSVCLQDQAMEPEIQTAWPWSWRHCGLSKCQNFSLNNTATHPHQHCCEYLRPLILWITEGNKHFVCHFRTREPLERFR